MTAEAVDAAVERIRRRDSTLAMNAEAAADFLTAGEGVGVLQQAGIQDDLWWRLPKKFPADSWSDIATAAAALFDELGLDRYAAIARSDDTVEILEAWHRSPRAGHERAMKARAASGVAAPDTDLLAWGTVFGSNESMALGLVERALEAAIVDGDLVPGGRGWKKRADEVADQALETPLEVIPGQTPLTLVTTERVETWLRGASDPELRHLREGVANRLLGPINPPAGLDSVVAPMRWLLAHAAEGIDLTKSGYLARALVVEAAERFDWWPWDKPPRSEVDLHQLGELREAASRLRLVRRKGRTLLATTNGGMLVSDPERLWQLLATSLGAEHEFDGVVAELIGLFLLQGRSEHNALPAFVATHLERLGWRHGSTPLDGGEVRSAVWERLWWWRTIGVAEHQSGRWDPGTHQQVEPPSEWLTAAGEGTVLAYLRHRATRPRTNPYG